MILYRNDSCFGSGIRDIFEVILYETTCLWNTDILEYCLNNFPLSGDLKNTLRQDINIIKENGERPDDIDLDIPSGDAFGRDVLPEDLATPGLDCGTAERWCPAFDVVPAFLITGYLTDRGIASAPYEETLDNLVKHAPKKLILNFDA